VFTSPVGENDGDIYIGKMHSAELKEGLFLNCQPEFKGLK
jgi:hypothetical protein